jgi:GDPmannose 4,6-dehydratase
MSARRALVCGVSGQDGSYLAKRLLGKGDQLHGTSLSCDDDSLVNLTRLGIREQVTLSQLELTDTAAVRAAVEAAEPQEIYNLAGQSSVGLSFAKPFESIESIARGTLNLLEAMRALGGGIRLFNAGSGETFGESGQGADEKSRFQPRSPYAAAKVSAYWLLDAYREAYGLWACTGILFNHESPLRPERFVTQKIIAAACRIAAGSGERLQLGNLEVSRDWGWAPEFVEAMWAMLQTDEPEDLVLATGETNPLQGFLEAAFTQLGLEVAEHVESNPSLLRPADIRVARGNPARAKQTLGWQAQHRMADVVRLMIAARQRQSAAGAAADAAT